MRKHAILVTVSTLLTILLTATVPAGAAGLHHVVLLSSPIGGMAPQSTDRAVPLGAAKSTAARLTPATTAMPQGVMQTPSTQRPEGCAGYSMISQIAAEWNRLGGANSFLHCPTTNTQVTVCDTTGRYNNFQGGAITWSPSAGAHETHGPIRAEWAALRFECSFLGLPTTDQTGTVCDGTGYYNNFRGGAITWSPSVGAHETHGPIRAQWAAVHFECSSLGLPYVDTQYSSRGGYYWQNYYKASQRTGGCIYYYPSSGSVGIIYGLYCIN